MRKSPLGGDRLSPFLLFLLLLVVYSVAKLGRRLGEVCVCTLSIEAVTLSLDRRKHDEKSYETRKRGQFPLLSASSRDKEP